MQPSTPAHRGTTMVDFRSFHLSALAAALLLAAALPATAQDAAATPRRDRLASLVKLIDKDGDGAISSAEAEAFAASRFDRLDSDHKGYLTLEAFEAPLRRAIDRANEARRPRIEKALPRLEAAFKAINKAGDGHLTKDEFLADSRARFAAADTDKDG